MTCLRGVSSFDSIRVIRTVAGLAPLTIVSSFLVSRADMHHSILTLLVRATLPLSSTRTIIDAFGEWTPNAFSNRILTVARLKYWDARVACSRERNKSIVGLLQL
jgi:hypothetical protein